MKRFLSLLLASVLAFSLTLSAGAFRFADDAELNYNEAVEVISALGIVSGYADGTFRPGGTLTRQAAAKIICSMLLGNDSVSALTVSEAPFKDVPASSQFAGPIAYCAQHGIISGYDDGTFRPTGTLTGYAFLKMLLCALGYESEVEGFTGRNWSVNVAKIAVGSGMVNGVKSFYGNQNATREEACLYALNTLKMDLIKYENRTSLVTSGGAPVITGGTAVPLTWAAIGGSDAADGHFDRAGGDGTVQFGERYFPKLVWEDTMDDFACPASRWTNQSRQIGVYTKAPTLSYSGSVAMNKIYKDLGMQDGDSHADIYINGVKQSVSGNLDAVRRSNEVQLSADAVSGGKIGPGTMVSVYLDDDNQVSINAVSVYAGKVSAVKVNTDGSAPTVTISPFDKKPAGVTTLSTEATGLASGGVVGYTYSDATKKIDAVWLLKSAEGKLSRRVVTESMTLGETVYPYGEELSFDAALRSGENSLTSGTTYRIYLDDTGYVLYIEPVAEAAKADTKT